MKGGCLQMRDERKGGGGCLGGRKRGEERRYVQRVYETVVGERKY